MVVTFDRQTCEACALFHRCPARLNPDQDGYVLTVDLVAANLERRRRAEASGVFKERYAIRAGIEATHSELKRRHGLSALRVRGRPRVELAVHLKALACNLKRMVRALMSTPDDLSPAMA
jgi:ferredoxin